MCNFNEKSRERNSGKEYYEIAVTISQAVYFKSAFFRIRGSCFNCMARGIWRKGEGWSG